jgi:cation diffusion facilitator family transporter
MDAYEKLRLGERGVWLSIAAYVCLAALKIAVGFAAGSEALRADGFNNSTDVIASIAVLIGLKIARIPPDGNHRYGHFRAETISAMLASMIMAGVGMEVMWSSARKLFFPSGEVAPPDMAAAWTALICAAVMGSVYVYNRRMAARLNSQALLAQAMDNRSDALVSLGVVAGVVGSRFGWPLMDPLVAGLVGLLICRTAWDIFKKTTHSLTDGFDADLLEKLKQTVQETHGVRALKDIRARTHGNEVFVDAIVLVDGDMSVAQSHVITERIEERMYDAHRIRHVHVHIEPYQRQPKLPGSR